MPQVVAEGPFREQPGNQSPHTQGQLAVAAPITALAAHHHLNKARTLIPLVPDLLITRANPPHRDAVALTDPCFFLIQTPINMQHSSF